jgi:hypothetical protein
MLRRVGGVGYRLRYDRDIRCTVQDQHGSYGQGVISLSLSVAARDLTLVNYLLLGLALFQFPFTFYLGLARRTASNKRPIPRG